MFFGLRGEGEIYSYCFALFRVSVRDDGAGSWVWMSG